MNATDSIKCGHTTETGIVSVVIPAYDGEKYIGAAIESILAQTYKGVEIIVVDDGSPKPMEECVSAYGSAVRYVRQENAGTAAARNRGVREARGEYIGLLDQDDLWLPQKLDRQIPRFAEDPRIGLVAAWMEVFESETGEVKGTFEPAAEMTVHDMIGFMLPPVQTMVFRRSALEAIGEFDETCPGTDDWDINIRIATEFRVVCVGEILGRCRVHGSQQGGNGERMYRNSMRVLDKHREVHPGCAECGRMVRRSRKIVREHYYNYLRGRARSAWRHGHYASAATQAVDAFWQHPTALKRVVGRLLFGEPEIQLK